MNKVYKIANPEGLSEAQIKAAEEYMNRACNSNAKSIISSITFACADVTVTKVTDALVKIALEGAKVNPVAKVCIAIGSVVIGFVAGNIISREIDHVFDATVEVIAIAKVKIEEAIQKAKESGEDVTVMVEQ